MIKPDRNPVYVNQSLSHIISNRKIKASEYMFDEE